MNWATIIVLVLLAGYVVSETIGIEHFTSPQRSDIGLSTDPSFSLEKETAGYERDLRYSEAFVDVQGLGVATDFCRVVRRNGHPDTLRVSCALGRRDGMDTMEYNSQTAAEGFRFSRDDYWRQGRRADYCRILKDEVSGEWFAGCAIAGPHGFKPGEINDAEPPPAIQKLLIAYEGIMVWFRWQDDREDYARNAAFTTHGTPVLPTLLNPVVTRGLQLNRWSLAAQEANQPPPPIRDYITWGEPGTFELYQGIQPRQIRAIACWVWWDAFEKFATIMESKNPNPAVGKMDRIALGVEGGGYDLPPAVPLTRQAEEVRPDVLQAIGQLTEPAYGLRPVSKPANGAMYYFEIWDQEQRIMRLNGPMGSARTNEWQHVAVTVTDSADWWPTWQLWINGALVGEKTDGRLSPAIELNENYIGSRMRGCIQDFRMYSTPLYPSKLKDAIEWSKPKLHPMP